MSSALIGTGPVQATEPLPGERSLTAEEKTLALQEMPAHEREELAPLFADDRNLIVAYSRRLLRLDTDSDGVVHPRLVGMYSAQTAALDIPSTAVAEFDDVNLSQYHIYLSLTAYRTCSTCLTWNIRAYFDWTTSPSTNGNEDRIALAWDDGLSLKSGSYYLSGQYSGGNNLYATSQTINASAGVGWKFYETQPGSGYGYATWGRGYATMQETSYHGQWTDVVYGYGHTGPFNFGGSIGIGPASITFNGSDEWEWFINVNVMT